MAIIAAGSALQLNVHFHILVPEGLFAAPSPGTGTRATFLPLPPPTDDEVKALLRRGGPHRDGGPSRGWDVFPGAASGGADP